MTYFLNTQTQRLQRLRAHSAFHDDVWRQTETGIMLPVPPPAEKESVESEPEWQASTSGLWLPVIAPPKMLRKPTCISLFTGAGGFDLGFHQAGWRILAASDYDAAACWTYCYNMGARPIQMHFLTPEDRDRFLHQVVKPSQKPPKEGSHWELVELDSRDRAYFHRRSGDQEWAEIEDATPHFFLGDVRKLTGDMILEAIGMQPGEPDCVIGGPPCQGFSLAGKREVMDPRNSLVFDFARRILELRPKSFVMENVPGMLSMITPEGIPVMDAFCKILSDGNYGEYHALKKALEANAKAWGVLQGQGTRKRKKEADEDEESPESELEQMTLF
jgi:DNA (cytosine-5)-methyltransferase 1